MTIDDKIIDEKLEYNISGKAAKILALSSGKIYKYEYLTGEEILPSDQSRIKEQAKLTYFLLSKSFEKQIKTIKNQGIMQFEAWKDIKIRRKSRTRINWRTFSKKVRTNEITNEIDKIKKMGRKKITKRFKDTLKAFEDFKNKQQSVWSNVFWYVKKYLYSEGICDTLYIEIKCKC